MKTDSFQRNTIKAVEMLGGMILGKRSRRTSLKNVIVFVCTKMGKTPFKAVLQKTTAVKN